MDTQIRILVVDDDPKICLLIEEVLVKEGYIVDVSFTGTDALQMIELYNYHLLITDFGMPGIDGLELIQKARKQNPDIRTVMITGNTIDDIITRSLRYEIDNHMKKPFDIIELRKMVKQTLCTHKMALEKM
jgi:DNA-binding response OmpR family regulator